LSWTIFLKFHSSRDRSQNSSILSRNPIISLLFFILVARFEILAY
jgi:hypothetical protein